MPRNGRNLKPVYLDTETGVTVDWDGRHWIVDGKSKHTDPRRATRAWERRCEEVAEERKGGRK